MIIEILKSFGSDTQNETSSSFDRKLQEDRMRRGLADPCEREVWTRKRARAQGPTRHSWLHSFGARFPAQTCAELCRLLQFLSLFGGLVNEGTAGCTCWLHLLAALAGCTCWLHCWLCSWLHIFSWQHSPKTRRRGAGTAVHLFGSGVLFRRRYEKEDGLAIQQIGSDFAD